MDRGRSRDVTDTVGESRAALVAVSLGLFCIQVDFFGLNLAIPDLAKSFRRQHR